MAGSEGARRLTEKPLERDELRDEAIELVHERRAANAESGHEVRPPPHSDGLAVPGMDADRALELDLVQAGDELTEFDRVELQVRLGEIHPPMEPDADAVKVGDDGAGARPDDDRGRHSGPHRCLLKRGALEQLGELVVRHITDLLRGPTAALGIEPPDRTEPAVRDRTIREPPGRPEVERVEHARYMAFGEAARRARRHRRTTPQ